MLHIDVYWGLTGLAELAEDWRQLQENLRHRRFIHHYGWWKSYLNALEPEPGAVCFIAIRREGQAVAILPLKRSISYRYGFPVRQWELPRHLHMPLNDILCERDANVAELIDALTMALDQHVSGGWDTLSFIGVMQESALTEYANSPHLPVVSALLKTCDSLSCANSYEEVTARFSRNFRSNLNKARNKLAREADVVFRSLMVQPDLASGFAEFVDIEDSGWKGAKGAGTSIKPHPELMNFYRSLIDEFSPTGEVMINSLSVGGKPIASQFCVKDNDTLYVLKLAYDESWSRIAPGNMLLERVIQEGIRSKSFQFINLVGDPPWFKDWAPESQDVNSIRLYNRTPMGLVLFGAMKIKQWLKPYYYKYLKRGRENGKKAARA